MDSSKPSPILPTMNADLALSQMQVERNKHKRLSESRASGIRAMVRGVFVGAVAMLGAYGLPDSAWALVVLLGGLAALLFLWGALRVIAALLLARK